jgi:hypothetical protein
MKLISNEAAATAWSREYTRMEPRVRAIAPDRVLEALDAEKDGRYADALHALASALDAYAGHYRTRMPDTPPTAVIVATRTSEWVLPGDVFLAPADGSQPAHVSVPGYGLHVLDPGKYAVVTREG